VFYRQTTDPSLLARATSEIRSAFPSSHNVTITDLLIATWDNVGYYYQKSDKVFYAAYSLNKVRIQAIKSNEAREE